MKKNMIHIAGWAALLVVGAIALTTTKSATETGLTREAQAKLVQVGVTGVTVTASGQELVLNGTPDKIAAAQAALKPDGFWTGPVTAVRTTAIAAASPSGASESASSTQSASATLSVSSSSVSTSSASASSATATVAATETAQPLSRAGQRCQDRINAVVARSGIRYRFNAYELTPQGERTMREVYRALQSCPADVKLTITGYTDNVGADEVNRSLSAGRAVDAMNALTAAGWPDEKVAAIGAGSADPVESNATAAGRKKNRRVVFTLSSAS
ncbi:OmpA family protein [Asticcacaulis sp. AC402]|uniref:OmpA family protein n=1 Tax=Asticcacaulis sp. AC402 TaxID=1282361 RepID=UPI0003C3D2FA|nr:OmpA family protein [Asticcacaulis sp. AC402]ESQ77606.1 hypothetical protein ABAC402_00320 [Asticcacaulis sp. AC402]